MQSTLHALVWNSVRYSGGAQLFMLSVCAVPLLIFASLASIDTAHALQAGDPVMWLLEVSLLPFVIFIGWLAAAISFANAHQLFNKPISNLSITCWRLGGGAVLLAIQMGVVIAAYNNLYDAGWPTAGAILFTIALWFVSQPFMLLSGRSFWSGLLTMIPMLLMGMWLLNRYKPMVGPLRGRRLDWNVIDWSESVQLVAIMVVFTWLTLRSVQLARCSESISVPAWLGRLIAMLKNRPTLLANQHRQPFRSSSRALFWYEWRWKGLALPTILISLLIIFVTAGLLQEFSVASFHTAICSAYMACLVPACVAGIFNALHFERLRLGLTSSSTDDGPAVDQLGSFQATRPVTNQALAQAALKASLGSLAVTVALWLCVAIPTWIAASSLGIPVIDRRLLRIPLGTLAMWIMLGNALALISTGRTKLVGGIFITVCLVAVTVMAFLQWLGREELNRWITSTLLLVTALVIVAGTIWTYHRALAGQLISLRSVGLATVIAIAVSGAGLGLSPQISLAVVTTWLTAGLLSVLPWAATPLAIRLNRHR